MRLARSKRTLCALTATIVLGIIGAGNANAAAPPVKATLSTQFGFQVNLTEVEKHGGSELEDVCTVASKDVCQAGSVNGIQGSFWGPEGVAGAANGNVYVADRQNHRVQEFTSTGKFVLMFGKEVNETTHGNVCTAAEIASSGVTCKAGVEGNGVGDFELPESIAVDPASGDVYVAELVVSGAFSERVQKFTHEGQFILEIGKEVNEKTKGNLCTHEEEVKEAVKCVGPAPVPSPYAPEPGSFNFETAGGNLLAIGPTGTLYVGDESRAQEFTASGQPSGEIPVEAGSKVDAVAIDQSENAYLYTRSYGANMIREFNKENTELSPLTVAPEEAGATVTRISGLAVDAQGRLAVTLEQQGVGTTRFGALYEASTGRLLSRFKVPGNQVEGVGFNGNDELYAGTVTNQEILAYELKVIPELSTGAASCVEGLERETDVVMDCTLGGQVNPEGVAETEAWFQYGLSETFGENTTKQPVTATGPVSSVVGARPDATYYYRIVGEDQNIKAPEHATGETTSFNTEYVAPSIVGTPSTLAITPASVVMFGELNPQNASTNYFFELAPSEEALAKCAGGTNANCPGVTLSTSGQSGRYGKVGAAFELTGLQPARHYSYRLFAESENAAKTDKLSKAGPIASFTTTAEPAPSVNTGYYSSVTATSALINGTVTPDGAPVTYAFELGVYEGTATRYGVIAGGTAEPGGGSIPISATLTGLQPGTTYAYRVSITSGYIENETHTLQGSTATFTTAGIPSVLTVPSVLMQLPVPNIAFPKEAGTSTPRTVKCKKGYKRNKHDKCVKLKRKGKSKRASRTHGHSPHKHRRAK